jgi:hypothetical protein
MAAPAVAHPTTNRLLSRLPKPDRERMLAGSEQVELAFEEILAHRASPLARVLSHRELHLARGADRQYLSRSALAGDEGMFGLPVSLGVATSNVRALVQGNGSALRMSTKVFRVSSPKRPLRQQMGR